MRAQKPISLFVCAALLCPTIVQAGAGGVLRVYNPQIPGQSAEEILQDPARNGYVRVIRSMPTPNCTYGNWRAPALWPMFWNDSSLEIAWVAESSQFQEWDQHYERNVPHPAPSGVDNSPRPRVVYFKGDTLPRDPGDTGLVVPVKDVLTQKYVYVRYGEFQKLWMAKLAGLALGTVTLGGRPIPPGRYPDSVRLFAACKFKKELYKIRRFDAAMQIDYASERNAWQGVQNGVDGILLVSSVPGLFELAALGGGLLIRTARRMIVRRVAGLLERAAAKQAAGLSEEEALRATLDLSVRRTPVRGLVQVVAYGGSGRVVAMPMLLDDAIQLAIASKTPMRLPLSLFGLDLSGEVTLGVPGRSVLEELMAELERRGVRLSASGTENMTRAASKAIRQAVRAGRGGKFIVPYEVAGKSGQFVIKVDYAGGVLRSLTFDEVASARVSLQSALRMRRAMDATMSRLKNMIENSFRYSENGKVTPLQLKKLFGEIKQYASANGIEITTGGGQSMGVYPKGLRSLRIVGVNLNRADPETLHEFMHLFHTVQMRVVLMHSGLSETEAAIYLSRLESGANYRTLERMAVETGSPLNRLVQGSLGARRFGDKVEALIDMVGEALRKGNVIAAARLGQGWNVERVYAVVTSQLTRATGSTLQQLFFQRVPFAVFALYYGFNMR
ncbi:MAG: hypothetical protein KGK30_05820, partial [Elusimicrobia bacterium]|nr:hypothetical protein [Elusimicrobiota bacterium]